MSVKIEQRKFLFVIDSLTTGGAQRQMVNLAIGLKRRNYQVELFCYASSNMLAQPLCDAGIPIHYYPKRARYSLGVIFALRKLIQDGKYDLVLAYLSTPSFYALVAGQLLGLRRVPVVVSERFRDLPQGVSFLEQFVRQFYRFSAHVIANSNHQRLTLAQKLPWLQGRLSTIYNGHDLQFFIPPLSESNNNPLRILVIASVSPYKNGLCLVEALNILRQQQNLFPCVSWIGERSKSGERLAYLNEMEKKIREYNLGQQWQWLDQRTDIVQQLHQHDVLVHPSYGEGLPNAVCEALACGRPVIVSNILDHAKIVQDGESGYLFNWQDPSDLASKIKLLATLSVEERAKMGHYGRLFAEANLSLDRLSDDYERLFLNILK
jgi:glycosyltransferase involved in cell wall biosynthesis